MREAALVLAFFPLVAFCVAGVAELRSGRSLAAKLSSLIPVILGVAAFGLSLAPQALFYLTPQASVTLSRVMTLFSGLIASSGSFVTYSRRSSSVLMATGGLFLALIWMFLGPARA